MIARQNGKTSQLAGVLEQLQAENAKLREQLEHVQPTDCEGNVLDIADTVHMLRSEYDGDHEWEDVVTELVLTKWGGDRWIVRGSKGEAWACDCAKTGCDEDAYEASDDVEPFGEPTLLEVENAKLREKLKEETAENKWAREFLNGIAERIRQANAHSLVNYVETIEDQNAKLRELVRAAWKCVHAGLSCSDCRLTAGGCTLQSAMRELGVEL